MKRLTLVLVGLSCLALAAQRPAPLEPWDGYLPEEDTNPETTPYASSRVCRSCHPSQYQSWYESYHRTMTQWASPESVVPHWEGVEFGYQGRSYRLFWRGDDFFVDMPKHGTAGVRSDERVELPVLMTTGSHQMQYYWMPVPWANPGERIEPIEGATEYERFCAGCHHDGAEGGTLEGALLGPNEVRAGWDAGPHHRELDDVDDGERRKIARFLERIQFPGRVVQFPFVYFIREGRWLHDSYTFLQPEEPFSRVEPYGKNWNGNCDGCHTTAPEYRWDRSEQLGQARIAELGIACEACHGPGRSHVERHKNPLRRYRAHFGDIAPDNIVNPAKLDASASASVCAQCHAELVPKSDDPPRQYQPGDPIELHAHVLQPTDPPYPEWLELALDDEPHLFRNAFWQDGTICIAGRDYNGLAKSACFLEGELSCVTCHTMHGSEPNDQLRAEAKGDGACLSCHAEFADDIEAHTHHPDTSAGSRCYGCHMPHTTWGLLGSIRAHRIDSPNVETSLTTGRPNACNLCHLDRSLGDIANWMTRWYDQPKVEVPRPHQDVAASIHWLLSGDAVQRATMAWHMGYPPAKRASGDGWQAAYLAELLDDPYAAVRLRAFESLSEYPGFQDLRYDFQWPSFQRRKAVLEAQGRVRWRGEPDRPALLIRGGEFVYAEILALKALRDDTPLLVAE